MFFFSKNKINKNKLELFTQCLVMMSIADGELADKEKEFLAQVALKLRDHYNYYKEIDAARIDLSQLNKTVNSLDIDDKYLLINLVIAVAEADGVLTFEEIGMVMVIAKMINFDMRTLKSHLADLVKDYKLNEQLFDEYFTIYLAKGKDAADIWLLANS